MMFARHLREGVRRGRIRCTIRIWVRPHVKVGGRYRMEEGSVVVDSIEPIEMAEITDDLARESGFPDVTALLETAKHGSGERAYLIRFHYLPPGAWTGPRAGHGRPVRGHGLDDRTPPAPARAPSRPIRRRG